MQKHIPNASTYRPWLGKEVNIALFALVEKRNSVALSELSVTDYLEKMILKWWKIEFPHADPPLSALIHPLNMWLLQMSVWRK